MGKISPRFPSRKTVAVTAGIATLAAVISTLSHPVDMRLDGHTMASDVSPVTTAKGTYVPLRVVAESLGADTNYDSKTGNIELVRANDTLRLRVGDRNATLNGYKMTLKSAPFSVHGRTLVPLATIARAFNTKVRYDAARAVVDVMTGPQQEPGATEGQ